MKTMSNKVKETVNGFLAVTILALLFAVGGIPLSAQNRANPSHTPINPAAAALIQNSYADVVSRVSPAVVTVHSTERSRSTRQGALPDDPFFREFFGDRLPQQQPRRLEGVASGVIVSSDGYVLTNHHVVDGAAEIRVETTDNRSFSAKLVGSDPPSDLAVLKIEARDLPVLTLGDSDRVKVGDIVLAVGNPLGIGQTVTSGIISAKSRATGLSDGSFEDFLQTDASINRGNSGGALVNTSGELVGINSQILSPSGFSIGIGFAIPSNMAKVVMNQLLQHGKVRRGMIGVQIQSVSADLAASLGLATARGAIVSSVQTGGPGEKAGIKRGDVITAINDQKISDSNNLRNTVAATAPGTPVTVTFVRDGREQQVSVTLAELPVSQTAGTDEGGGQDSTGGGKYGLTIEPLSAETASRLGLTPGDLGLLVSRVDPAGAAADAGFRQNDLIQEVNRQPVRTIPDFNAAIQRSGSRPALILVNRRGNVIYLTLRPAK